MRRFSHGLAFVVLVLASGWCLPALAELKWCGHCGHHSDCNKVCRLVCEEKKVSITCWGTACEDFCIPGHSKPGCRHCDEVCEECTEPCNPEVPHSVAIPFVWFDWDPSCDAKMYTKTKLMKKTVTKKVPSYKWVVEDLCVPCETNCPPTQVEPGAQLPNPPRISAHVIPWQPRPASTLSTADVPARTVEIAPVATSRRTPTLFERLFK